MGSYSRVLLKGQTRVHILLPGMRMKGASGLDATYIGVVCQEDSTLSNPGRPADLGRWMEYNIEPNSLVTDWWSSRSEADTELGTDDGIELGTHDDTCDRPGRKYGTDLSMIHPSFQQGHPHLGIQGGTLPCVTALVVVLATALPRVLGKLAPSGGETIALILMQVFFLVVGANGNLVDAVTKAPSVFAFALVQVTVHLGIVLAAGKLMGFERKPLLIASKRRRGRWRRPRRGVELADRTWDPGGHGASVDEAGGVEEGVKRSSAKRTPAPSQVPIDDGGEVDGDWGDRGAALPVVPLSSKAAAAPPEYERSSMKEWLFSRVLALDFLRPRR
uniref:Uncharacterized protein n=1 Tax=Oryza glumipatula TaxID=40148 RepID=A0A0D9ZBM9_9ORYZ